MDTQTIFFLVPILLSVVLCATLAILAWRRRIVQGGLVFILLMCATGVWALTYFLELVSPGLDQKLFWANCQYFGIAATPPLWFLFCLQYNGTVFLRRERAWLVGLAGFPILTVLLVWTNSLHGLMRRSVFLDTSGPIAVIGKVYGPWFWVHTVFSYALMLAGTAVLIRSALTGQGLYRRQRIIIILAGLLPWIGNVLYLSGLTHRIDPSAPAFALAGGLFAWAFLRWHFLDLIPLARDFILESLEDGVMVLDKLARVVDVNARGASILGQPAARLIGLSAAEALHNWPELQAALGKGDASDGEINLLACQDETWYDLHAAGVHDQNGSLAGRMVVFREITALHRAEEELRKLNEDLEKRVHERTDELSQTNGLLSDELESRKRAETALSISEERYALAARGSNDGLWDWDLHSGSVYFSERWCQMLGLGKNEMVGSLNEWILRIHPDDRSRVQHDIDMHLMGKQDEFSNEHRIQHADGTYRWWLARGQAVFDKEHVASRMAGSFSDINERKKGEEQIFFNAFHDSLTGLPNRALFMDRLSQAIARVKRHAEYQFGVLYLDFDRFKLINDSLGHNIGDMLLIASSRRLESAIRGVDTVARLGGDEFVILLDDIHGEQDAIFVANRVQSELVLPFQLEGFQVYNSASVGIVLSGPEYENPDDILRDADIAMYQAKQGRGGRHAIFDTVMREKTRTRMEIETSLRMALEHGEISLHYQPLVILENGRLNGFEALMRWQHPIRGNIEPDRFIPIAEETGLIYPLGRWALQTACKQMADWLARLPGAAGLHMNVNVSARQLAQSSFAQEVLETLAKAGLASQGLQLEITETALIEESDVVIDNLNQLTEAGVLVHLDDFGTGYSSLSYLNRYPIHSIKIDPKFTTQLQPGNKAEEIVRTILTMARELHMPVTAEGVETPQQLDFLQSLNCQFGQGFWISRPLTAAKAEETILQRTAAQ